MTFYPYANAVLNKSVGTFNGVPLVPVIHNRTLLDLTAGSYTTI
jgi:hypothetical protein